MSGLALDDLTLSHFRSHKAARLSLDSRPVAIYGPNGAGKTNILEAISLLSPGRGLRRATAAEMARQPEALGWKINAVLRSLHQVHEVTTSADPDSNRQVRIDEKTASQTALGRIARILWLVPSMDRLWLEGAEGRRRFLDRMTLSFEPSHAEATLTYEKSMRERNRLLKDHVNDPAWYVALESQMARSGAAINANRTLALSRVAEMQSDATSAFPTADLTLSGQDSIETHDEIALVTAFADGRAKDLLAGRTLTGPHRADLTAIYSTKGVDARQCSTGEQKALLISLILANARALAQDFGGPPILLLDEVAAHLDVDRRATLYDEIHRLGAQAFMTGTGADMFASLNDRAQYFEVTETDGVSNVTAVSQPD